MGWIKAGLVSTAEAIALGLLSFPSTFYRLGMVGGLIATVFLGVLSYITAVMMVNFKLKHMGVMHYNDVGGVLFGRTGSIVFSIGITLKCMGLAGSHVLVGQTALSNISSKAICTIWYGFIVTIVSIMMSYNRQWGKLWWISFVSLACLLVTSVITMVAVGVQSAAVLMVKNVPIYWRAFPKNPTLISVMGGFTNIIFAYGGNMGVFSFCSEMQRPQDFKKSFLLVQAASIISYCIVGGVIYAFGGQYVTSPALTMTTKPVRITSYSIALVTIMVSGILAVNIGAKLLYASSLRKSELLTSKSWKAQMWWMGCISIFWVVGFIVAELIPFFNSLLTIISSLFSVRFTFGFAGFMWIYAEHPRFAKPGETRAIKTLGKRAMFGIAILTIIISLATTPLGMYSAVETIRSGYSSGSFTHPFSC